MRASPMGSAGSSTLASSSPKPVRARGPPSLPPVNFELKNWFVALVNFSAVVDLTLLKMYLTSSTHGVCVLHTDVYGMLQDAEHLSPSCFERCIGTARRTITLCFARDRC